jgi:hypothetical protein
MRVKRRRRKTHEYRFEARVFASIPIRAESEKEARKRLGEALDCVDVTFGAMEGDPVCGGASLSTDDGEPDLVEIDGEDV